jgi:hypothetical protein
MDNNIGQSYDIPIHDIKTIVEVQEYSFYYLLVLSIFALILFAGLVYLVYRYIKNKNSYNQRREHLKIINNLDLDDTKKAAYALSLYGATFKDDGERQKGMYENLTSRLEIYKYKKSVDAFDKETLSYIELYKGMIDV